MNARRRNWPLWAGFIISLTALLSYFLIFLKFPFTRDIPWVNFLLFAIGGVFLVVALRRPYGQPNLYGGKIVGPVLATVSLLAFCFFCAFTFYFARQLPASTGSPRVSQKAPDFALPDTHGVSVSLSALLTGPLDPSNAVVGVPKGVLLVFYRGYW